MNIFCNKGVLNVLIVGCITLSAIACPPPPWYPCAPGCNTQCYNCDNYHDSDSDGYGDCTPKPNTCDNCTNCITNPPHCRTDGTYCIGSAFQSGSIISKKLKAGQINMLSASAGSDFDCHNTTDSCGHSCTTTEDDPITVTWSASAGTFPNGTTGTSVAWQAPNEVGDVNITASWANSNHDKYYESGDPQTVTMTIADPNVGKPESTAPGTDPVTLTGKFTAYARDIMIKGRAMDIVVERNYNSDPNNGVGNAGFGWGWDMSYHIKVRLQTDPAVIKLYEGHNRPLTYRRALGGDPKIYLPMPGCYDRIVKNANNTYTLTKKDGTKYEFNTSGNLTEIRDRNDNTLTFNCNSGGKPLTVIDDLGRTITFGYDGSGRLHTITDFANRVWTYEYDGSDNLLSIKTPATSEYPNGLTTTYGYSGHNLTYITDPNNDTWLANTYTSGKVTSQTYGTEATSLEFHPEGNYTKITDPNGYVTESTYNGFGRVISESKEKSHIIGVSDPLAGWWTFDEGSGNIAHDCSVYAHNGTIHGATWVSGCISGALRFDGSDDYVEIAAGGLTTDFWVKPSDEDGCVLSRGGCYELFYHHDTQLFVFVVGDGWRWGGDAGYVFTEEGSVPPGNWYHVCVADDCDGIKIYLNDELVDTSTEHIGTVGAAPLTIGAESIDSYPRYFFKGDLDDIRTYYEDSWAIDEYYYYNTLYKYNANQELIKKTFPGGNYITYAYDANGNVTCMAAEPANGEPNIVTRFTYGAYNQVATVTDPCSNVYTFNYTGGNLTSIAFPEVPVPNGNENPVVGFTYNSYGQVETITDPNSLVTLFEYYSSGNGKGQIWKVRVDPTGLNYTTTYGYDAVGNITQITDANGASTSFAVNSLDQTTSATDPHSHVTSMAYNPAKMLKEITTSIGANNQTTQYAYNILDKVRAITDPLGNVTRYGFDTRHDVNDINDAEGNHTRAVYDERQLLSKITDANGGVTDVNYTDNGQIYTVRDANGNITKYDYDGFDRLTKITYPNSSYEQFTYDKNSNVLTRRTRKGDTITYTYDALNRLRTKTRPSESAYTYTYDIAGRLKEVKYGTTVKASYDYDRFGRLFKTTNPDNRMVQYAYDKLGRRTRLTYPDNTYINYYYDAMSRLTDINDQSNNRIVHYNYDEFSRMTKATFGTSNNAYEQFTYDGTGGNGLHIASVSYSVSSLNSFNYTYDNVGNVTQRTYGSDTFDFDYDNRYQLIFTDYPSLWFFMDKYYYYYDNIGNRTSVYEYLQVGPPSYYMQTYLHNRSNQYTSVGGTAYSYDNNGNLANDGTQKYYYDCENRLTDVNTVGNAQIAHYEYDYQGRRISKTDYTPNPDVCTVFVYDGDHIIADYNESGVLQRKYVYGPGIDEPVCMINVSGQNETKYYYFRDALGSVVALLNNAGTIVEAYHYDPFGGPVIHLLGNDGICFTVDDGINVSFKSDYGNRFMFTGREYDSESSLYYYRARMYSPWLGRFLQTDPIGYYDSMNLYQYCGNNPVNWIDPMGLWRWPDYWAVNINITIPTPWTGTILGWSGTASIDRYGNWYWSPIGGGAGKSLTGVSASLTANWMNKNTKPPENQLHDMLTSHGFNGAAGFWGGVAESWTPGTGTATGVGFVTPQIGASYNYSFQGGRRKP